jgi:hypothetical protein
MLFVNSSSHWVFATTDVNRLCYIHSEDSKNYGSERLNAIYLMNGQGYDLTLVPPSKAYPYPLCHVSLFLFLGSSGKEHVSDLGNQLWH